MQAKVVNLLEAALPQAAQTARNKDSAADSAFSRCLADKQRQTAPGAQPRAKAGQPEAKPLAKPQEPKRKAEQATETERKEQQTAVTDDPARPPEAPPNQPVEAVQSAVFAPAAPVLFSQATTAVAYMNAETASSAAGAATGSGQFLQDLQTLAAGGRLNSTVNAAALLAEANEQRQSLQVAQTMRDAALQMTLGPQPSGGSANLLTQPEQAIAGQLAAAAMATAGVAEDAARTALSAAGQPALAAKQQPFAGKAGAVSPDNPLAASLTAPAAESHGGQTNAAAEGAHAALPTAERAASGADEQAGAQLDQFGKPEQQEALTKGAQQPDDSAGTFSLPSVQAPLETANYGVKPQEQPALNAREVLRQVADQVRIVHRPGVEEMTMRLKPEALGDVTVKLMLEGGKLTARFHADNLEVRQVLESSLQQLKLELSAAGLKVHDVGVYAGLGNPLPQQQGERGQAWAGMSGGEQRKVVPEELVAQLEQQNAVSSVEDDLAVDYRV